MGEEYTIEDVLMELNLAKTEFDKLRYVVDSLITIIVYIEDECEYDECEELLEYDVEKYFDCGAAS